MENIRDEKTGKFSGNYKEFFPLQTNTIDNLIGGTKVGGLVCLDEYIPKPTFVYRPSFPTEEAIRKIYRGKMEKIMSIPRILHKELVFKKV